MRDNWITVDGKWINLDTVKDIYVTYISENSGYGILYSCNPYDKNINYQPLISGFDTLEEAQEYLDKLMGEE